jgi:predicted lipase
VSLFSQTEAFILSFSNTIKMTAITIYDEVNVFLLPARLSYGFTIILDLARDGKLKIEIPSTLQDMDLERFLTESMDLTEYNGGKGLRLQQIMSILEHNKKALTEEFDDGHFKKIDADFFADAAVFFAEMEKGLLDDVAKSFYLSFHRSIQQGVACVYTILKDTLSKAITVSFRGSVSDTTRDWSINLAPGTTRMKTPEKIKHKMPENLREGILIRSGFHEYLFNNEKIEEQRYARIREDIQKLLQDETGYKIYVTGHSLGGALASIFSTWLAGGAAPEDTYLRKNVPIPKPVTCITFAAPFSGTNEFRFAHENLEREGLLRSVRITNYDDVVPTLPAASWLFLGPRMTHAGINIRLISRGRSIVEHSSRANFRTAIRNSMLKPAWRHLTTKAHSLETHKDRLENGKEKLLGMTIDGLYKDNTIVSQDFIEGIIN